MLDLRVEICAWNLLGLINYYMYDSITMETVRPYIGLLRATAYVAE